MASTSLTSGVLQRHSHTPRTSTSRTPASVGQPLAPHRHNPARSPAVAHSGRRSPSPNYFGLSLEPARDTMTSGGGHQARANWSPPTSNVRSAAASSPRAIPLDQNPDFEAFKRQSERAGFNSGSLSGYPIAGPPTSMLNDSGRASAGIASPVRGPPPVSSRPTATAKGFKPPEPKQRSPKRLLSSPAPDVTDRPRRNSPASFTEREAAMAPRPRRLVPDEHESRMSLPDTTASFPSTLANARAETLPSSLNDQDASGGSSFASTQEVADLLDAFGDDVLLLDLRVSTQYAKSRVSDALNLCIPTTLLKRPSYNPQKLAETFKAIEQKQKFERWKSCKYIIVYDASSSKIKDAAPCAKMLEKFGNEGWTGASYILRGGYVDFAKRFPDRISHGSAAHGGSSSLLTGKSNLPPVIGGCPMPLTASAANPFFSNIRQNMDLIGGVGQIALQYPNSITKQQTDDLPRWLKAVADPRDAGKEVSEKFLHIEQREQTRMQKALGGPTASGTPRAEVEVPVQLAGIEKGAKNRYNNIWPFEHSRVKIEGISSGCCDYFNASHIQSEWSNKRYIATQAPVVATFNDFWNVVWQQDVRVIVMLTAESEGGQQKAHNYWSERRYGPFRVEFLSERRASLEPSRIHQHHDARPSMGRRRSTNPQQGRPQPAQHNSSESGSPNSDRPYVTVRRFTLSHSEEPFARMREITQLQYSDWPDFGAPAHPAHLLGLVEQCDAVVRSNGSYSGSRPESPDSRPIIVHCSAGCGRTGTFCTVDSVIDLLKQQKRESHNHMASPRNVRQPTPMDIDQRNHNGWINDDTIDLIEKTVQDFRKQRLSMVQSLRQYVLCYESVLEWLCEQTPKSA
ncbi:phosphotyrosine-specific Ptp2-like protein [Tothia fuscella]|uniref:protein-tyrosine-phosphatase n=1 Tax=Tothia fuscella TaxID=1048955 RepID=A0A9P4TUK8_9PEZI|nr:phosphotyrosine-specific Ptp2-like protein [Tothia fuscella]